MNPSFEYFEWNPAFMKLISSGLNQKGDMYVHFTESALDRPDIVIIRKLSEVADLFVFCTKDIVRYERVSILSMIYHRNNLPFIKYQKRIFHLIITIKMAVLLHVKERICSKIMNVCYLHLS